MASSAWFSNIARSVAITAAQILGASPNFSNNVGSMNATT
ncbi:hypothetical protein M2432_001076 [Mycobacterium sp. OTB74]|nr:hypothetical protein [Mycobacterium sp. OTB74]